ncbi:hypothetical protein BJ166DRAFT_535804 [Pestalotiopsis sp. NC0098]|nr:hypothetical protein BJ166DRAFT_535804 [Pestalotiopsis sp. NC0098]
MTNNSVLAGSQRSQEKKQQSKASGALTPLPRYSDGLLQLPECPEPWLLHRYLHSGDPLRRLRTKKRTQSFTSSRPIAESEMHPVVVFLSGAFSIVTSILVGPSLFPCQPEKRTMVVNILTARARVDLCTIASDSGSRPRLIPSPTIVLIVVQIYTLSTIALHQCRPRDRWRHATMLAVVMLGTTINPPMYMNVAAILEHMAVNLPQLVSLGLLLSAIGHSWMQKQERTWLSSHEDGPIFDHSTSTYDKLGIQQEKDSSV